MRRSDQVPNAHSRPSVPHQLPDTLAGEWDLPIVDLQLLILPPVVMICIAMQRMYRQLVEFGSSDSPYPTRGPVYAECFSMRSLTTLTNLTDRVLALHPGTGTLGRKEARDLPPVSQVSISLSKNTKWSTALASTHSRRCESRSAFTLESCVSSVLRV